VTIASDLRLIATGDRAEVKHFVAIGGHRTDFGSADDPMVGIRIGGVNVFGGGFALYSTGHAVVGAVEASGDTSGADHFIGWRIRHALKFDNLNGVSGDPAHPDNIIFDIKPNPDGGTGISAGGPVTAPEGGTAATDIAINVAGADLARGRDAVSCRMWSRRS
jgi:hypothetical protein